MYIIFDEFDDLITQTNDDEQDTKPIQKTFRLLAVIIQFFF
jgi:hypothetical protein